MEISGPRNLAGWEWGKVGGESSLECCVNCVGPVGVVALQLEKARVFQPVVNESWERDPASLLKDRGFRPWCVGGGSWIDLLGAAPVDCPEQGLLMGMMV